MRIKTALLWWLVTSMEHSSLTEEDRTIKNVMPLINILFPGVNYFSITGLTEIMNNLVVPTLKKRHPELVIAPAESIEAGATTEVAVMLPSNGYEWQDSADWRKKFQQLLKAA